MATDRTPSMVDHIFEAVAGVRATKARTPTELARWQLEIDGRPGCSLVLEVMLRSLAHVEPDTLRSELGKQLYDDIEQDLPTRSYGPREKRRKGRKTIEEENLDGSLPWTPETCVRFLSHRGVMPKNRVLRDRLLDASAKLIGGHLDKHRTRTLDIVPLIRARYGSERDFMKAITEDLCGPDHGRPRLPDSFISWFGPSFEVPPNAAHPGPLKGLADQALVFLGQDQDSGRRYVRLGGSPHSGKKTVLRYLVGSLPGGKLKLASGLRLPVLAVALNDHTPDEFVDVVHSFYIKSRIPEIHKGSDPAELSVRGKLEEIQVLASQKPACIILADVGTIDDNELVRGWSGDHVGDLVFALLRGHRQFRLILTSSDGELSSFDKEAERLCEEHRFLRVPEALRRDEIEGIPEQFQPELPSDVRASGLAWRLAQSLLSLAATRTASYGGAMRIRRQCGACLEDGTPQRFVELIFQLLTTRERVIVGLISSSRDGLRESVLRRMATTMVHAGVLPDLGGTFEIPPLSDLQSSLEGLVQSRTISSDQGHGRHATPVTETLLLLDAGWRGHVLEIWWRSDPKVARFAQWLIAREAAHQGRTNRVWSRGQGGSVNLGRDVQGLQALLASIDPILIVAHENVPLPAPTQVDVHEDVQLPEPLEASVLPVLEKPGPLPDPRSVIRYAYHQLYRRDIEGLNFRLLTINEDARSRLRILISFFTPDVPWLEASDQSLERTFRPYGHLVAAFDPNERISMLTSVAMAALRLQRYRLLSAAVRLGEETFASSGKAVDRLEFMRLLRCEVQAGLLLGGNPDAFIGGPQTHPAATHAFDVQLIDVGKRIEFIINRYFDVEGPDGSRDPRNLQARGKLYAALGELHHVSGRLGSARRAFAKALKAERGLLTAESEATSMAPVLGGRGIRSYVRLLIDSARFGERGTRWECVVEGGMPMPIPTRVLHLPDVAKAERYHQVNLRRSSQGRSIDTIGIKIDEARLAVLNLEIARALSLLDSALELRFGNGSSLELLLELTALRTRLLIDAALMLLDQTRSPDLDLSGCAADIRSWLTLHQGQRAAPAPETLLELAKRSNGTLNRLIGFIGTASNPYVTLSRYLTGLRLATEAQATRPGTEEAFEKIDGARSIVEGAIRHMMETSYWLHLKEARVVHAHLQRCLTERDAVPLPTKHDDLLPS